MGVLKKGQTGYTLIEVLLAMGIFAVAFLALAGMQVRASKATANARVVSRALELADARAEYYHAMPLYPDFLDTTLAAPSRFTAPSQLHAGTHETKVGDFTVISRIVDDEPLAPVKNIYTPKPDPARITVSKCIFIAVYETGRPENILAQIEMVKFWDRDA